MESIMRRSFDYEVPFIVCHQETRLSQRPQIERDLFTMSELECRDESNYLQNQLPLLLLLADRFALMMSKIANFLSIMSTGCVDLLR